MLKVKDCKFIWCLAIAWIYLILPFPAISGPVVRNSALLSETEAARITGRILDAETGEALVGVTVVVKGQQTGVTTDINGQFSIDATPGVTLLISYTGYDDVEIIAQSAALGDLLLMEKDNRLNEVVVIGYGSQKKKRPHGCGVFGKCQGN